MTEICIVELQGEEVKDRLSSSVACRIFLNPNAKVNVPCH